MDHGRADEAPRDVEEASAGNGRAQSSVPTFLERRKYFFGQQFLLQLMLPPLRDRFILDIEIFVLVFFFSENILKLVFQVFLCFEWE